MNLVARHEGFLCLYKDGELRGLIRKNGQLEMFSVSPMSLSRLTEILEADAVEYTKVFLPKSEASRQKSVNT